MPARFVIGRAGTGKTRFCLDAILAQLAADPLGPTIYWIVPKQATFTYQRLLATASPRQGYVRVRILALDELGEDVLAECGGRSAPSLSATGRQIILGHLLRRHAEELRTFKSTAHRPGLAAELNATFAELERAGQDADSLTALLADLENAGATDQPLPRAMADKLHDIRLLYDAYQTYIGQDRLDPHRRQQHVLDSIDKCGCIRDAHFYVDGLLEMCDFERRLVARLARVGQSMHVTLMLDPASKLVANPSLNPGELDLFRRTEETYRRLHAALVDENVTLEKPLLLKKSQRFTSPALHHLEHQLFGPGKKFDESSTDVAFIQAPDRRSEVDAAAREIRALVASGYRLRDIVVLMRNLEDYRDLIDSSFSEHRIAFFADRRLTAAHHPLLQLVRGAMLLAAGDWPRETIRPLLKGGLLPIDLTDADLLENYLLEHRLAGDVWTDAKPWRYHRAARREDEDGDARDDSRDIVNTIRRKVAAPLIPWVAFARTGETHAVRDYLRELLDLLERLDVRKKLGEWMKEAFDAKRFEEHDEHAQVWSEFVALMDQMAEIIGDEKFSPADMLALIDSALAEFDLATTPPAVDQVLVGDVERTRVAPSKITILLGMNESVFPALQSERAILSDAERAELDRRGIDLEPDTQRRLLNERLLVYLAITRSSGRLIVCRSESSEERRELGESVFYRMLGDVLPKARRTVVSSWHAPALREIGTPRQLISTLATWARLPASLQQQNAAAEAADLFHAMLPHAQGPDRLAQSLAAAWPGVAYDNSPALSKSAAAKLFASPLAGSVSRFESFAACPFRHFARYGLGLVSREEETVTSLDLGNVYHGILQQLVGKLADDKLHLASLPPAESKTLVRDLAQQVGAELRGELMLSSARNQYLLGRIEQTLDRVLAGQALAAAKGVFRPVATEVDFGFPDAKLPPLELSTPAGNVLRLRGRIDRIDTSETGGALVIDYKLGKKQLDLSDVFHGLSLQLLTYLLLLERNGTPLAGTPLTPRAAFYVQMLRPLAPVPHPSKADETDSETFHSKTKPRGVIDFAAVNMLDRDLQSGASPVANVYITQKGELGMRHASDAVTTDELRALLDHVEATLTQLADRIIAGEISVRPYRIANRRACQHCEYMDVCRFDRQTNGYNDLTSKRRLDVLAELAAPPSAQTPYRGSPEDDA